MCLSSTTKIKYIIIVICLLEIKMDSNTMVTDELQNKIGTSNNMNISMAFQKLVTINPPRYTELCETVNKSFEEITDSIR